MTTGNVHSVSLAQARPPEEEAPRLPEQQEHWRAPARFGSVPVEEYPIGWDTHRRFEKHYPRVELPTQIVDRVSFGNPEVEPNRLLWGDNLHVMRQIESNSIDLVYLDPPFFSGRPYNVMWGDANEVRSFNDIWEGGMTGYLIWLNARLYEAKRLLKPAGSIYLHCDWHASHYIKVEMDKIFGYGNFRNEIIWCYTGPSNAKRNFQRKHDTVLFYAKGSEWNFNGEDVRVPYKSFGIQGENPRRGIFRAGSKAERVQELIDIGKIPRDWWDDGFLTNVSAWRNELIGYPTQKPEALLERIIRSSSNEGDIVADFVMGGAPLVLWHKDSADALLVAISHASRLPSPPNESSNRPLPASLAIPLRRTSLWNTGASTKRTVSRRCRLAIFVASFSTVTARRVRRTTTIILFTAGETTVQFGLVSLIKPNGSTITT